MDERSVNEPTMDEPTVAESTVELQVLEQELTDPDLERLLLSILLEDRSLPISLWANLLSARELVVRARASPTLSSRAVPSSFAKLSCQALLPSSLATLYRPSQRLMHMARYSMLLRFDQQLSRLYAASVPGDPVEARASHPNP